MFRIRLIVWRNSSLVSTHPRTFFVPLAAVVIVPLSPLRASISLVPCFLHRSGRYPSRAVPVRRVLRWSRFRSIRYVRSRHAR